MLSTDVRSTAPTSTHAASRMVFEIGFGGSVTTIKVVGRGGSAAANASDAARLFSLLFFVVEESIGVLFQRLDGGWGEDKRY